MIRLPRVSLVRAAARFVSLGPRVGVLVGALVGALAVAAPALALEINHADRAQLEQLNGIGVALAERILVERERAGPFRDWADLERRVKGLRGARGERLAAQGVTVNGQPASRAQRENQRENK